jgi:hypothetical protein
MDELMRPPAEETKRRWRKLEADLAERLEGWLTVASGAKSDKGDAKSYLFLGECKYRWSWSEKDDFFMPLDLQWLETIWRHAQAKKKVPLLALEWGDGNRACFIPSEFFFTKVWLTGGGELPVDTPGRIINIPVGDSSCYMDYTFTNIEIPESHWLMFPWEDLSWLRIEELEERKRIGKKQKSTLHKSKTAWPKRPFPTKIVR